MSSIPSFPFKTTYDLKVGPPARSFHEYAQEVTVNYKALLDSKTSEDELQDYLERHPSFVPGALTPGTQSGHLPMYEALIAQPPLPGFDAKIPDFLWLSQHSGCIYAALIEIECPTKLLFTQDGQQRAEFTQAYTQLKEWRRWFAEGPNRQLFLDHYGISARDLFSKDFDLHFILIYGRRSEYENNPKLSRRRNTLMSGNNEELMSFDRLTPHPWLSSAVTVKAKGHARFEVKHVPSTFEIRPSEVGDLLHFDGMAEAVQRNKENSQERRDFLVSRLPYWKQWKQSDSSKNCIYSLADKE